MRVVNHRMEFRASDFQTQRFHCGAFTILYDPLSGWWLSLPLWKMMEFVSWDDEIPNWMESHKIHVPNHQPVVILYVCTHFCCSLMVSAPWWAPEIPHGDLQRTMTIFWVSRLQIHDQKDTSDLWSQSPTNRGSLLGSPRFRRRTDPTHSPPKCNPYPRKLKLETQNENARGARFIHNNQTIKPCLK